MSDADHTSDRPEGGRLTRRPPSWWDAFEVPREHAGAHLRTWLEENVPDPLEHDYILSTDGSGCTKGWGANAAIIEEVGSTTDDNWRGIVWRDVRLSATYGSTVNRNEMEALLNGLHAIVSHRLSQLETEARDDEDATPPPANPLSQLVGNNRITIMWYTDRENLAKSLLFGDDGDTLYSRNKERDLWMRFSALSRHVCITPMPAERNTRRYQGAADALCTIARDALKASANQLEVVTEPFIHFDLWKAPKSQHATLWNSTRSQRAMF